MKISEIMTPSPEFVTPDDSVIEVARIMERENVGLVPIVESRDTRKAIGVITDRDIVMRVVAQGRDPHSITNLREVMTPELVTCSPNDDVDACNAQMAENQLRRVLVVDEHGSLVGVVAQADLARALPKEKVGETVQAISAEPPND
jgi:CBS domain-containing protein